MWIEVAFFKSMMLDAPGAVEGSRKGKVPKGYNTWSYISWAWH